MGEKISIVVKSTLRWRSTYRNAGGFLLRVMAVRARISSNGSIKKKVAVYRVSPLLVTWSTKKAKIGRAGAILCPSPRCSLGAWGAWQSARCRAWGDKTRSSNLNITWTTELAPLAGSARLLGSPRSPGSPHAPRPPSTTREPTDFYHLNLVWHQQPRRWRRPERFFFSNHLQSAPLLSRQKHRLLTNRS